MLSLRPGVWNEPFRQVMAPIFPCKERSNYDLAGNELGDKVIRSAVGSSSEHES
jgi:hypothetical protein